MSKINIAIVHYNTPLLTECLVRSINKFTPGSNIFIFDNSDKNPFTYRQSNITYIDNTNCQIINFEEWLKQFPRRSNVVYSAKHCYTIQKMINMLNAPFILLDSDVLLKRDISELYDENFAFVGSIAKKSKRIYPFICFINPTLLDKYNIKYFDKDKMLGLGGDQENCDTGSILYDNINIIPNRIINYEDYIEHYSGGSYEPDVFEQTGHGKQLNKKDWTEKYKDLWK